MIKLFIFNDPVGAPGRRQGGTDVKRNLKLVLLNLGIVVTAVVSYSEGLLGLRPTDPSILKAGLSILIGLLLGFGLIVGNFLLLKDPKPTAKPLELRSAKQIEEALSRFTGSHYFGDLANTGLTQYRRLSDCAARATAAVHLKFQKGTLSADRYVGAISAAENAAMDNIRTMAMRLSVLSDEEYMRLLDRKNDDIPDDIQEQQLALYHKNLAFIRHGVAVNESLILKLETLAFEFSDAAAEEAGKADKTIEEIAALTEELKFYRQA